MKVSIETNGELTVRYPLTRDGNDTEVAVTMNLYQVFEAMGDDEKLLVAEALTWDKVLEQAIRRLTGESWNASGGRDRELSAEVLAKISEHAIPSSDPRYYFWSLIEPLKKLASEIEHSETLYWKLFHDRRELPVYANGELPQTVGELFRLILDRPEYVCGEPYGRKESSPGFNQGSRFEEFKKQVFDLIESRCSQPTKEPTR